MTAAPLFEARAISKNYLSGQDKLTVLRDVSISVAPGEMAAIIGASGSGKTTLLQILGTLASPSTGELYFADNRLTGQNARELARFRNRSLGFIFQFHHLLPEFTALENVMMPALIAGRKKAESLAPAEKLLKAVELGHRLEHRVAELSGGEQQRTALARALIMEPALLLADEPTGNLDSRAGELVFELLGRLCRERSMAVIMVTHNMALAERMDVIYTLADGRLKEMPPR
ncbi:MAG: ABC transporter ATP-binding protein [Desulfopila sp.]